MKIILKQPREVFYTFTMSDYDDVSSLSYELGENPLFADKKECEDYIKKAYANRPHTLFKVELSKEGS